jgi:hypothetical protein
VTRGLSPAAIEVMNRGKMRTLAHALQVMGFQASDHRTVAIARSMMDGHKARSFQDKPTDIQTRKFIETHMEAIAFANRVCPRKIGTASVAAVIARAYYWHDPAALERFCLAMADKIPPGENGPADKTARRLKVVAGSMAGYGAAWRAGLFRKAQAALMAFLQGKVMDKLCEKDENLFPLPEETKE